MATRVYQFGLLAPSINADKVAQQMRLSWEYRRDLTVGPIKAYRDEIRRLQSGPEVTVAQRNYQLAKDKYDTLREDLSDTRQQTHTRSESTETKDALQSLKKDLKTANKELKAARNKNLGDKKADKDKAGDLLNTAMRRERGKAIEKGLFWGSYLPVEEDVNRAQKALLWNTKNSLNPQPLHVPTWSGEGRVAVQLQKGPLASVLLQNTDTRVRLQLDPDNFAKST